MLARGTSGQRNPSRVQSTTVPSTRPDRSLRKPERLPWMTHTMDAEQLLGTLIRGALGGRRKRSHGALRFLTGGRHSLLNAGTLLTAAGVAWGLYESATRQGGTMPPAASPGGGPAPTATGTGGRTSVPPLPVPGGSEAAAASGATRAELGTAADPPVTAASVPPDVLRVIRVTIAAARADGTLTAREEQAILEHARTVGADSLVAQELLQPTPLPALVADVPSAQRNDLYTLAFAIARADETVSGGERIFLAQLAHQLGLDAASVTELERVAAERIAQGS
jgi:hypothetical protein